MIANLLLSKFAELHLNSYWTIRIYLIFTTNKTIWASLSQSHSLECNIWHKWDCSMLNFRSWKILKKNLPFFNDERQKKRCQWGSGDLQRSRAGWRVTLTPYKAGAVSSNLSNGMYWIQQALKKLNTENHTIIHIRYFCELNPIYIRFYSVLIFFSGEKY